VAQTRERVKSDRTSARRSPSHRTARQVSTREVICRISSALFPRLCPLSFLQHYIQRRPRVASNLDRRRGASLLARTPVSLLSLIFTSLLQPKTKWETWRDTRGSIALIREDYCATCSICRCDAATAYVSEHWRNSVNIREGPINSEIPLSSPSSFPDEKDEQGSIMIAVKKKTYLTAHVELYI